MSTYTISRNGEQFGPYSEADMHAHINSGHVVPEDLTWKEGMATWLPVAQIFSSGTQRNTADAPSPTLQSNQQNVSEAWKIKFKLLEKIGAGESFFYQAMATPEFRALSFWEKYKLGFNILAFLFGPFYYLVKGMRLKGFVILGAGCLLNAAFALVEIAVGLSLPISFYYLPVGVICAQLANYDFFKHVKHNEKMWGGVPNFLSTPMGVAGFLLGAIILGSVAVWYSPQAPNEMLANVSGVWRGNSDQAMVSVNLRGSKGVVNINDIIIPVTVDNVDQRNHIIQLGVATNDGKKGALVIRQVFASDGSFTLQITLPNGTQDGLSFVRNL